MAYQMLITVNKTDLLTILTRNRDKHRTVFEDSLKGYKQRMIDILQDEIRQLERGRIPDIRILYSRPEDHTRDYNRVIGMLEMDKNPEFTLDETTYRQYVDDDWSWKRQWAKMSNTYATQSYTSAYGEYDDPDD
jgi:hypothetical protein